MKISQLKNLPTKPGIYKFKDLTGELLYIGKAKNLKNRIQSYFSKSADLTPAKRLMTEKINKIEYTIVSNETEALLLESTLIKKHQPPFNVILKDDKYWQYIKVTNEPFSRILTVRKIAKDKAKYFGPYTAGSAVKQTMSLLKRLFPYRTCERDLSKLPKGRICLQYHLGRCLGPCEKKCTKKEYDEMVKRAIDFLSGKTEKIIKDLKLRMKQAADKKAFERAAKYRDQLQAIKKLTIKQRVISTKLENHDYLSIYQEDNLAAATLLKIRQGKLLDQQNFLLKNAGIFTKTELLEQFVNQYYSQTNDFPKKLILPDKIEAPIKIIVAKIGDKKKLLDLAKTNAQEYFKQQQTSWRKAKQTADKKLIDLQKILNLPNVPKRIEGYDISNILGNEAVGSLVVMTAGKIDKNQYRHFKIKTIKGANDPAMIGEIIKRRLTHNEWPAPDLILIDGGPTQLSAAINALGDKKIPLIGLSKKQEEIYLPHQEIPIKLPKFSPALQLLQQLRDEAHRFAITYHKKLRRKRLINI